MLTCEEVSVLEPQGRQVISKWRQSGGKEGLRIAFQAEESAKRKDFRSESLGHLPKYCHESWVLGRRRREMGLERVTSQNRQRNLGSIGSFKQGPCPVRFVLQCRCPSSQLSLVGNRSNPGRQDTN